MAKNIEKVERSSLGMRSALFDEMDALRSGESTPQRAAALAKLAVQIINTVNMEVDYQKHVASNPTGAGGMKTISLQLGK